MKDSMVAVRAVFAVLLFCGALVLPADGASRKDYFHVFVFNCLWPIPSDYVLNTNERSRISYFKNNERSAGFISIVPYDKSFESESYFAIQSREDVSGLHVLHLKQKKDAAPKGSPSRAVVVTDDHTAITIIGDDLDQLGYMVRECARTKREAQG